MRLTAENKSKITNRIVESAASAFRLNGYDHVNIDVIMNGAGLTRGAFYAHFKSKEEIFVHVVRYQHPLLKLLKQRKGGSPEQLHSELKDIFSQYLAPQNLENVFNGCTLAASIGDAVRGSEAVRQAYEDAWLEVLHEMARQQNVAPESFASALVLATGAVRTARAIQNPDVRASLLKSAFGSFVEMIDQILKGKF